MNCHVIEVLWVLNTFSLKQKYTATVVLQEQKVLLEYQSPVKKIHGH